MKLVSDVQGIAVFGIAYLIYGFYFYVLNECSYSIHFSCFCHRYSLYHMVD